MGSQLAKSNHQNSSFSIKSSSATTTNSSLLGTNNTNASSSTASQPSESGSRLVKGIVTVRSAQDDSTASLVQLAQSYQQRLPPVQRPLIQTGQAALPNTLPQLSHASLVDLGGDLERELRKNSESIAVEQAKLSQQIRRVDHQLSVLANVYSGDKQKRFNKAKDNFDKFQEIETLIVKVEADIDQLVVLFDRLNQALPSGVALEPFPKK